jgi:3-oxoacyl-[acyl-carrier protein] reductase
LRLSAGWSDLRRGAGAFDIERQQRTARVSSFEALDANLSRAPVGSLDGQAALVTGAAMGIGRAIAETFLARGAKVAIADIDEAAAGATAAELGSAAFAVRCDVTQPADVEAAVNATVERFGRLDIVVNNAGITRDAMLHKLSVEDWDLVIDVHLKGTFLVTQAAARYFRERNAGGAIVNISSLAAKGGNMGQINYVAAKSGMVGMTKTSARELARFGVRVNAIQPGFIDTAMTRAMPEEAKKQRLSEIPLGRAGTVDDVARAVAFLASDEAAYVTGIVLEVSGGRLM